MEQGVGVLIVDGPFGIEPNLRAALEHMPSLRTISEADLEDGATGDFAGQPVAILSARQADIGAACERVAMLREAYPAVRVLAAFRALDADVIRLLLEAGIDAFVAGSLPARDVCMAVLTLARGSAGVTEADDEAGTTGAEGADASSLTPREAEVLRFLSSGFSNKEVARRLSLSVRTVETHRLNLRRKTQTGRLKDLVSLARQLGLDPVLDSDNRRGTARH